MAELLVKDGHLVTKDGHLLSGADCSCCNFLPCAPCLSTSATPTVSYSWTHEIVSVDDSGCPDGDVDLTCQEADILAFLDGAGSGTSSPLTYDGPTNPCQWVGGGVASDYSFWTIVFSPEPTSSGLGITHGQLSATNALEWTKEGCSSGSFSGSQSLEFTIDCMTVDGTCIRTFTVRLTIFGVSVNW